jgi:hypothetical protein
MPRTYAVFRVSDLVLIHSTGEAPACWQRLSTALELHGHRTRLVDLPVDRPQLLAADYANIMREQVGHIAEPIVLAHSGSGTLLPAASKALKARHRVCACRVGAEPAGQL